MINNRYGGLSGLVQFIKEAISYYNKKKSSSKRNEADSMGESKRELRFEPFATVIKTKYGFAIEPNDTEMPIQELYLSEEDRLLYENDYIMYVTDFINTLNPARELVEDDVRKWLLLEGKELTHSLVWVLLHKMDCLLEEDTFMRQVKQLEEANKLTFSNLPDIKKDGN